MWRILNAITYPRQSQIEKEKNFVQRMGVAIPAYECMYIVWLQIKYMYYT